MATPVAITAPAVLIEAAQRFRAATAAEKQAEVDRVAASEAYTAAQDRYEAAKQAMFVAGDALAAAANA